MNHSFLVCRYVLVVFSTTEMYYKVLYIRHDFLPEILCKVRELYNL